MKRYCTDDENYKHATLGDVLDELDSDGRLEVGALYYEGDFERLVPSRLLDAEQVLEAADERGYDLIGETWDSLAVSEEGMAELQSLLNEWASRHIDVSQFYTIVGTSRQLTVTEADLPANAEAKPTREAGSA